MVFSYYFDFITHSCYFISYNYNSYYQLYLRKTCLELASVTTLKYQWIDLLFYMQCYTFVHNG